MHSHLSASLVGWSTTMNGDAVDTNQEQQQKRIRTTTTTPANASCLRSVFVVCGGVTAANTSSVMSEWERLPCRLLIERILCYYVVAFAFAFAKTCVPLKNVPHVSRRAHDRSIDQPTNELTNGSYVCACHAFSLVPLLCNALSLFLRLVFLPLDRLLALSVRLTLLHCDPYNPMADRLWWLCLVCHTTVYRIASACVYFIWQNL